MPVQINEVVIRAIVDRDDRNNTQERMGTSTGKKDSQEELIENILEIIDEKKER